MITIGIALALMIPGPAIELPTEGGVDSVWVLIDASGEAEDRRARSVAG